MADYQPPFEYVCTADNHHIGANAPILGGCPCYRLGKPCPGELRRIGRGSRSEKPS